MNRYQLSLKSLVLALALAFTGAPTSAAVISSNFSFVLGTGSFFDGSGPFAECQRGDAGSCTDTDAQSVSGTFQKFNPALGTLTGVEIVLDSVLRLGTEIFGTGNGGVATVNGSTTYDVGGLFTGTIVAPTITCTPFCNEFTPGGTTNYDVDGISVVLASMFGDFTGPGTETWTIDQSVVVEGSATNGGLIARTRTNELFTRGWEGTVTVNYTYAPAAAVPLPATPFLIAAGLLVMGVARPARRLR